MNKEAISMDMAALLVLKDTLRRLDYTIGIAEKMNLETHAQDAYRSIYEAKKQLSIAIAHYEKSIS